MKKDSGKRVKLGLFVTTSIVVMMAAIFLVGQKQHLFGTSFHVTGIFTDVTGLQVGNNVRFSGVNIGSVEAVTITSNNAVRVDMVIAEDAHKFIKKDTEASIGAESMMGNKIVVLTSGSEDAPSVANHDEVRTVAPIAFDDILKQVKNTSDNAAVIMGNLALLTSKMKSGHGTLGKMFMDDAFARDLGATMGNLKQASVGFKETMEAAQHSWLLWGFGGKKEADNKKDADKKVDGKADAKDADTKASEKTVRAMSPAALLPASRVQ